MYANKARRSERSSYSGLCHRSVYIVDASTSNHMAIETTLRFEGTRYSLKFSHYAIRCPTRLSDRPSPFGSRSADPPNNRTAIVLDDANSIFVYVNPLSAIAWRKTAPKMHSFHGDFQYFRRVLNLNGSEIVKLR